MKKIALVSLLIVVGLFVVTSCGKGKMSATISVSVGGATHISSIKEGNTLEYELSGEKYAFEVVELTEKEMKLKANKGGLESADAAVSKNNEFVVKKGSKVSLNNEADEKIVFSY